MIKRPSRVVELILILLLAACSSTNSTSTTAEVEENAILDLVCGSESRAECLPKLCDLEDSCPVIRALSSRAVFDFIETYSKCPDCNTPDLSPELGIGKCIEYSVSAISTGWTVIFWVSDKCSFRYGSPGDSQIYIQLNSDASHIEDIVPPKKYLADPLYCQVEADCFSLSGSGVEFIGCSNYFYAPLSWSGFYPGNECTCSAGQCTEN